MSGLYLSLAVSLCGLAGAGHHGAASLADAIAAKWVQEADRGEPARVGSLLASREEAGVCGMFDMFMFLYV